MINVNNRKLCENCFAEVTVEPCPYCGFSRDLYRHDPITLDQGSVLDKRYLIGGVIGKGGFGITYLAYDLKLDTKIAVKEYYPMGLAIRNPGSMKVSVSNKDSEQSFRSGAEKFYNEAKVVAKFNGNPNIVSVHDFFYENDTVYFTMGYLQGETLKSYLKRSGITEGQAVRVMQDISNALIASHSMNILHRDVSPDNIMLCDDGTIKLLDFGAARQVMAEQSQSLSVILKQGFAPLEQYQKRGRQGPWTDIYALGATIYNALTGVSIDDPMTRLEDDREFESNIHGINDNLWQIIRKCMMVRIEDRYQDIFELKKDLNNVGIEPEPFVDVEIDMQMPEIETAKAFNPRANDENATELLEESSGSLADNRTVAMAPEAAHSYVMPMAETKPEPSFEPVRPGLSSAARSVQGAPAGRSAARAPQRVPESRPRRSRAKRNRQILLIIGALATLVVILLVVVIILFVKSRDDDTEDVAVNDIEVTSEDYSSDSDDSDVSDKTEEVVEEETEPEEEVVEEEPEPAKEEAAEEETDRVEEEIHEEESEPQEEYVDNNDYYVVKAPDGYVNLRTGPGKEYDIITPIHNGEYIQSLNEKAKASNGKTWVKVAWWADGHVEGWVIGSQVELVTD